MKLKLFILLVTALIIGLFSYGFFQISSLKKQVQSFKVIPEEIIKEIDAEQGDFESAV